MRRLHGKPHAQASTTPRLADPIRKQMSVGRRYKLGMLFVIGLLLSGCQADMSSTPAPVVSAYPAAAVPTVSVVPASTSTATPTLIATTTPSPDANAALFATLMAGTPIPSSTPGGPFRAGYVDIGGFSLFLSCEGSGSPTVILEQGAGGTAGNWIAVQPKISEFTRVCSYTRAAKGVGQHPHTVQTSVDNLQRLLTTANIEAPYIMVGFSWGGFVSRLYAHQHPDDVAGLVLVDSRADTPESFKVLEDYVIQAANRGEQWAIDQLEDWEPLRNPDTTWEGMDEFTSMQQVAAVTSLGELPLVVLSAGILDQLQSRVWPPDDNEFAVNYHQERQRALVELSTNSVQIIAEDSRHTIPFDAPEMVVEAVRKVMDMAK